MSAGFGIEGPTRTKVDGCVQVYTPRESTCPDSSTLGLVLADGKAPAGQSQRCRVFTWCLPWFYELPHPQSQVEYHGAQPEPLFTIFYELTVLVGVVLADGEAPTGCA